jgi:glycosyltransferase involved in cell wall biosynthesis
MSENRVTAIMPLKNFHPDFLRKALGSMFDQIRTDWFLLIVVEPYEHDLFQQLLTAELHDERIRLVDNQGRKLAGAVNTGMSSAPSDFVALLLADDMWSNNALAVLNDFIVKNPGIDFFHSSHQIIDEDDRPISSVHRSQLHVAIDDFRRGSPVKHLLCWRRDKALACGGLDESLNSVGPDDYDLPWTMAEHGATFMAIGECLYYYRDHRACYRLTTHIPLDVHKREIARIMEKHNVDAPSIRRIIAAAERSYLRQCLYRSAFDQWLKEKLRHDARRGWREKYH